MNYRKIPALKRDYLAAVEARDDVAAIDILNELNDMMADDHQAFIAFLAEVDIKREARS